jgi:antitoxin VapB
MGSLWVISVTVQAKIFKSNQSQAVRLPKAVALPASVKEVEITIVGRSRLISPAGESWDCWFDGESVTDDFLQEREQPESQEREFLS